jgi:hypothetical protein
VAAARWMAISLWLRLRSGAGDQRGQSALEYLLVAGAVVAVFVVGMFAWNQVVALALGVLCHSVDPVESAAGSVACI